jgi:BirA family biotin operon repressor/biotin-[acetyl-CoA-carboxylase] ligase
VRLRSDDPPAPTLALVAAVALQTVIAVHVPQARIKWPNDLIADGAKLAGILLEREGEAVVVGFGANLAIYPDDVPRPATSVAALAGSAPDPHGFLETLASSFDAALVLWRSEGIAPLRKRWLAAAHPPGTPLSTPAGEGAFDGLDDGGALRLRLADGSMRVIHAGDVFLI